jgi:protein-disulfide isomerase
MLADKAIGSASAPVTIVEYSSLGCSHCGTFHDTVLPQIKAAYLDTGRVRFVYRDFPLDGASLSAAMIARCSGARYFTVLDLIFRSQGTWTRANDVVAALKQAVVPSGMTAGDVDACIASVALRDGIIAAMDAARSQYAVNATPTFIIGGQKVVGALSFAEFDAILGPLVH